MHRIAFHCHRAKDTIPCAGQPNFPYVLITLLIFLSTTAFGQEDEVVIHYIFGSNRDTVVTPTFFNQNSKSAIARIQGKWILADHFLAFHQREKLTGKCEVEFIGDSVVSDMLIFFDNRRIYFSNDSLLLFKNTEEGYMTNLNRMQYGYFIGNDALLLNYNPVYSDIIRTAMVNDTIFFNDVLIFRRSNADSD